MISLVLFLVTHIRSAGNCENGCSKHGTCEVNQNCKCYTGLDGDPIWTGPDCSLRACPKDYAWVGSVVGANDLHPREECSNKGLCDRRYDRLCQCPFTSYQHTLSIQCTIKLYHPNLSTYHLILYEHALSPNLHTLSPRPINSPYQNSPSTHSINTPYHDILSLGTDCVSVSSVTRVWPVSEQAVRTSVTDTAPVSPRSISPSEQSEVRKPICV